MGDESVYKVNGVIVDVESFNLRKNNETFIFGTVAVHYIVEYGKLIHNLITHENIYKDPEEKIVALKIGDSDEP